METMISIAIKTLEDKPSLPFDVIFQAIQNDLMDKWLLQHSDMNEEELLMKKRGELYKLLTVDGNFKRLQDGTWTTEIKEY